MEEKFFTQLNPHYSFVDSRNQAEIARQGRFLEKGALMRMIPYLAGGGSSTPSPWGSNQSVDAGVAGQFTLDHYLERYHLKCDQVINWNPSVARPEPIEFCIKNLVVNPGHQLSLQKHQGREEFWVVKKGLLTVIVDNRRFEAIEAQAIFIPMGATHCMSNCTDEPIEVQELQLGICREEDNIRLLDATRDEQGHPAPRPTYPITTELEYKSAILFAQVANEIAMQRGMSVDPQFLPFIKK